MKIVFMGTPDFSVPALQRLTQEHDVVCVYTREPKVAGRGNLLSKTPVHLFAEQSGIEVRTPKTLKNIDEQKKFADLNADIAVVAAYGLILPKEILEAFPLGCVNIHASLLPRWRGAAPIQRAIEAGDKESGVTVMQMAEGLDTGDMLAKTVVEIKQDTTGELLHDKLSLAGADLISKVLANIKKYPPIKQDDSLSCYAQKIDKSECKINFAASSYDLCNKIRAFNPYPAVYFEYNKERFKILYAEKSSKKLSVGQIMQEDDKLFIGCENGSLEVKKMQRQGKKAMDTEELLKGFSFESGYIIA